MGPDGKSYPHVVQLLNRYLLHLMNDIGEDDERRPMADAFRWCSITVNQDLQTARHRDPGNEGMSAIIALGTFQGAGRLRYWEDDLGAPHKKE